MKFLRIFRIDNFWNFLDCKFFEFSKFKCLEIVSIGKFIKLAPKIGNFGGIYIWKFFEFYKSEILKVEY